MINLLQYDILIDEGLGFCNELFESKVAGKSNIIILIHLNDNEIVGSYYSIEFPSNNKDYYNKYFKDDKSFLFYFNQNTNSKEIYNANVDSDQHLRIWHENILGSGNTSNKDGFWIESAFPNLIYSSKKCNSNPHDMANSSFFINKNAQGFSYSRIFIVQIK